MTVNVSGALSHHSRIAGCGKIILTALVLFFAVRITPAAQEISLEEIPGLRERALVMHIVSRIIEQDQQVVWNAENTRVTIPGRPVGLKLVGSNLVVVVHFTPFLRANNQNVLVAQAQIWINVPNEGLRYHTTMQTIPLKLSEQIYFFPLGSIDTKDEAQIEIQVLLEPYTGSSADIPNHRNRHGMDRNRKSEIPAIPDSSNSADNGEDRK